MPNPSQSRSRFSESETEAYYDAEDALYRSFWDAEGSLHWGVFGHGPPTGGVENVRATFLAACDRLNEIMLEESGIGNGSHVLDLGCGNGNTSLWLSRTTGANVTGIDLSGVRIDNANASLAESPELASKVDFHKASATDLPFADDTFTHVWSQATIYHVPDKTTTLEEAYRVLQPGGFMVFDDLTKPKPEISDEARTYVYDRLLFDTDFSFFSYMDALRETGFKVLDARDLSTHLGHSYTCLSKMAAGGEDPERRERFAALSDAYLKMVNAVRNEELGWAQYRCVK